MKPKNNPPMNLAEARASITKLMTYLPWPRLTEKMNYCELLPDVGGDVIDLPIVEQPEALMMNIGPFVYRKLPAHWKQPFYFHQRRRFRNAQVQRLYPLSQNADGTVPGDLDENTDGIVAGMLLLALRPMPSPLRTALMEHAGKSWLGMYFAALGVVYEHETTRLLAGVANDPRLAASLFRENPDLAGPLVKLALRQNDIWSSTIALFQPDAEQWLDRVGTIGLCNARAAVTALTLLPSAPEEFKAAWIERVRSGNPQFSYQAVRWTQSTWPVAAWRPLRDTLKNVAVQDRAANWFHWHRDIEPENAEAAVSDENASVLWQAELIDQVKDSGHDLRERMSHQLQENPGDAEALLTLRWLSRRRKRP
jgi:hypothetical protein